MSEIVSLLKEIRDEQKLQSKEIQKLVKRIDKIERRKIVVREKKSVEEITKGRKILQTLKQFSGSQKIKFFTPQKLEWLAKHDHHLDRTFVKFVQQFARETYSFCQKGARVYSYNGRIFAEVVNKPEFWRELREDLVENFCEDFKKHILFGEEQEHYLYDDETCWEPHLRRAYKAYIVCLNQFSKKYKLVFFKNTFSEHSNGILIDQLRKLTKKNLRS